MAAPLTWREVTAPDFGTALRATAVTSDNLSRGFNTLGDALGNFKTYQQGEAAGQVMNNAAGFSDPEKLRAAIADGSLFGGIDRSLVTPQTLAALNAQPGTLLGQGLEQERLTHARQVDPLLVDSQTNQNARQLIDNKFATAADPLRLAGLGLDNQGKAIGNDFNRQATPLRLTGLADANSSSEAGTRDQVQRTGQSDVLFSRGTSDYQAQQDALPFLTQLKTGINGPDDVQALLASPAVQALSPMARQHVVDAAQAQLSGSPVPGAPGQGPGSRGIASAVAPTPGSAAASPFSAIPGNLAQPGDPDISTMKIGDVQNHQTKTLLPRTGATSAGAFQINRDTITQYAPKALGPDWKDQVYTPENQDKIAHAIFDDNKAGNLKSQWTSLPDATPGAYANKSWDQMRGLITKGESRDVTGVNQELYNLNKEHSSYSAQADQATSRINMALSQANSNNIDSKYAATQQDNATAGEIAARVVGSPDKNGNNQSTSAYRDYPQAKYLNELNRVKDATPGATYATAAAILEAHPEGAGFYARHAPALLGGHTAEPNTDAVDAEIASLNTGTTTAGAEANKSALALAGIIGSAQQNYQDDAVNLAKALHNPSLPPDQIAGYRNKLSISRAILEDKLKSQRADSTMNPMKSSQSTGEAKGSNSSTAATTQGDTMALTDTPENEPARVAPAATLAPASAALAQATAAPAAAPQSPAQVQAATQATADALQAAQGASDQARAKLSAARQRGDDTSSIMNEVRQTERVLQQAKLDHLLQGYSATQPAQVAAPLVRGTRAAPRVSASDLIGIASRD